MKKVFSVACVLCVFIAFAACNRGKAASGGGASAGSASVKPVEWNMASIYVDPGEGDHTYQSLGSAMQKFIKDVNEKSNGRLVIKGFYSSVLGSAVDAFQQTERNEVQVYYGQPMSSIATRFGAWGLPYLFRDYDEIRAIACDPDSEFFKLAAQWLGEHNTVLLASGITNTRGIFNTKHRVVKVADVKDLKIRTYEDPVVSAFWEDICQAMPMPVGEVYTALQTKSVDGLEFSVNSIITRRYYEVGKFFTNINWQWTAGADFVVNADAFKALPADLQKIVTDCARDAAVFQGEQEMKDEQICFDSLARQGVDVYLMTDAERQDWIDYATRISEKLRKGVGAESYDRVIDIVARDRAAMKK
jgi:TRAP-type C4-dicarboxylate transport system substrate-binding protein